MPDPFADFKDLADFDLYAGDGHFIAAATKYATGHLYALDLRSHSMTHLTVSDQVERNKEHDTRAPSNANTSKPCGKVPPRAARFSTFGTARASTFANGISGRKTPSIS